MFHRPRYVRSHTNVRIIVRDSNYGHWFVFCPINIISFFRFSGFHFSQFVPKVEGDAWEVVGHGTSDIYRWISSKTTIVPFILPVYTMIALFDEWKWCFGSSCNKQSKCICIFSRTVILTSTVIHNTDHEKWSSRYHLTLTYIYKE